MKACAMSYSPPFQSVMLPMSGIDAVALVTICLACSVKRSRRSGEDEIPVQIVRRGQIGSRFHQSCSFCIVSKSSSRVASSRTTASLL